MVMIYTLLFFCRFRALAWLIDWVKVLRPSRYEMGHFGDVLLYPISWLSIEETEPNTAKANNTGTKWQQYTKRKPYPPLQPFYGPFPGPPRWAGARRELLDFMVQGKINRGRHTDHPAGRHSIRTKRCSPLSFPMFLQAGCPSSAQPTVSKHWRQTLM